MKKFSIILNVVLVLVTLFFVVFALLKTNEATKQASLNMQLREEVGYLTKIAERTAASALEAESEAKLAEAKALELAIQLEICQSSK